jgi:uncharacterized protein (TIGR02117 family)
MPCPASRLEPSWLAGLLLGALLCAQPTCRAADTGRQQVRIHIVGNGWHAGLVLPAAGLNTQVPALRERFPQAQHYEIGWGDMGFYQTRDVTAGLAVQALFASKGALLHVVGLPAALAPHLRGADSAEICVSREQHDHMVRLIAQAFVHDAAGQLEPRGPGLYGDSQFYNAYGRYSLLNTCNRWTATVLQAAGLPISPRISLTAASVLRAARAHGSTCPAEAIHTQGIETR